MYYVTQIYDADQVWYVVEQRRREQTVMQFEIAADAEKYAASLNGKEATDGSNTAD
jgi:hypothetical protein